MSHQKVYANNLTDATSERISSAHFFAHTRGTCYKELHGMRKSRKKDPPHRILKQSTPIKIKKNSAASRHQVPHLPEECATNMTSWPDQA